MAQQEFLIVLLYLLTLEFKAAKLFQRQTNIFRFWWLITSFPKAYIFIPTGKRSPRAAVIGPGAFWLSADYLFLDAKKYLSIYSVGLGRSFGGRPDIMMSPSDTGPPPSCPLRATPRGCHRASLPWLNLSYWKENKWHTSRLLPTAAVLLARVGAEDLPKKLLEKYHSCKGKGGGGHRPGGSSPIPHLTAAPVYYILVFGQLWENDWRVSFYYNIHHFINLIFCDIL